MARISDTKTIFLDRDFPMLKNEIDMIQQEEFSNLENQKIDVLVKWMIESLQKLVIYFFKASFH